MHWRAARVAGRGILEMPSQLADVESCAQETGPRQLRWISPAFVLNADVGGGVQRSCISAGCR